MSNSETSFFMFNIYEVSQKTVILIEHLVKLFCKLLLMILWRLIFNFLCLYIFIFKNIFYIKFIIILIIKLNYEIVCVFL